MLRPSAFISLGVAAFKISARVASSPNTRAFSAIIHCSAHEYRLLAYLMHRAGQVVSRTELTEHLYAQDFDRDSNTVEVFVARLRRKLGAERIETVRGLGYKLVAQP